MAEKKDWDKVEMPDDPDLLFQGGMQDSKENYMKSRKVQRLHVIILIAVILVVNLVVLAIVRCRMKRQMTDRLSTQVQGAVSEYFQLA